MRFETSFQIPRLDETVRSAASDFWSRRGVTFILTSDSLLLGERGSLWGNLVAFDMSRLATDLTITFAADHVECVLEIDPRFQLITEWNRAWWEMELRAFESFLLHGDDQPEIWKAFRRRYGSASRKWAFNLAAAGAGMTADDRAWLTALLERKGGENLPIPVDAGKPAVENAPIPSSGPADYSRS